MPLIDLQPRLAGLARSSPPSDLAGCAPPPAFCLPLPLPSLAALLLPALQLLPLLEGGRIFPNA
ncbi:hypothetical protein JTE90_018145, partial [Oedothorax gibbosus]